MSVFATDMFVGRWCPVVLEVIFWVKFPNFFLLMLLVLYHSIDAGRDWGQEEKEMTEDEMAGWHHSLNGCEFE